MTDHRRHITRIEARAHEVLDTINAGATPQERRATTVALLAPRPGDCDAAFLAPLAAAARSHYADGWEDSLVPSSPQPGAVISLHGATPRELGEGGELGSRFPGDFRQLSRLLRPGRVWITWCYLRPGRRVGKSYNGMVWLDDHFAWFPRLWHIPLAETD